MIRVMLLGYIASVIRNFKIIPVIFLKKMVIWVAILPRVHLLIKVMPNFWKAVYKNTYVRIFSSGLANISYFYHHLKAEAVRDYVNVRYFDTKDPFDSWRLTCQYVCNLWYVIDASANFYYHRLTSIPVWISVYVHCKLWNENNNLFPNLNGTTVVVWEWISNFIPHYAGHVIT